MAKMPDDAPSSTHVTLRLPDDIAAELDRLASLLDRSRSWVMVRALRHYLKSEGAELLEDAEAIAELERGDSVPAQHVLGEMDEIIGRAPAKRARKR
jgi:predicted transcriptional regulator